MSSAGETAAVEEGLLVRGGVAAEQTVAVGEAAKPPDDVGVLTRVFQVLGIVGVLKQRDAMQLIGQVLGMHEGQIEEFEQDRIDPLICTPRNGVAGDVARLRVAGKGL